MYHEQAGDLRIFAGKQHPFCGDRAQSRLQLEEPGDIALPYPEWDAVRDDKKREYYLITVIGDRRVDLKVFRRAHGLRPLSFATAEELAEILHLTPGSVTPFGLLNDAARRVHFYLDAAFCGNKIGVHPNDNTATVWLAANDLFALLQAQGCDVSTTEQ